MDVPSPVTPPRTRHFGPMKFSSALVLVLAAGAGVALVRSYMNSLSEKALVWKTMSLRNESDTYDLLAVAHSFLAGVVLIFGVDLLIERARTRKAPRPWGIGRMTIAMTSLSLVGMRLYDFVEGNYFIRDLLKGAGISEYNLQALTTLHYVQEGLFSKFPIALAAAWVSYRLSGRGPREPADLKEGMGQLLGWAIFACFAAWSVLPDLCQGG